jgi:spermidine synthase
VTLSSGDARYEIQKLSKRYDFIIHDCFTGGSEPTHLLTIEMLEQLRGLLSEQGILALNYVRFTKGEGTKAVASVYKTLKEVLPNIRVFVTEKKEFTDFIFLASRRDIPLDARKIIIILKTAINSRKTRNNPVHAGRPE